MIKVMVEEKQCIWGPFPIETGRLIIRPVVSSDAQAMHDAKMETLDQLKLWMPWAHNPQSLEADRVVLQEQEDKFQKAEDCMLAVIEKSAGRIVAFTGIHEPNWETREFTGGYWVRLSAQGKGYAQEMTHALVRHIFQHLKASRFIIAAADGNPASQAVIRKCGFEFTHRVEKDASNPNKEDTLYYVLKPA